MIVIYIIITIWNVSTLYASSGLVLIAGDTCACICTIFCDLLSWCFTSLTLTQQSENILNVRCSVSSYIKTAKPLRSWWRLKKRGASPTCEMPGYRTKYHQGVPYLIYFLEKQYKTVKNNTCMNYFIIVLRLNNDDRLELTLPLDSQPL